LLRSIFVSENPFYMKYFIISLMLSVCLHTQAQVSKGSYLISSKISLSRDKSNSGVSKTTSNAFSFSPTLGYFPVNRLCVGVTFPFGFSSFKSSPQNTVNNPSDYTSSSRSLNIGPFIRYYIPITEKFFFLAETSYSWGSGRSKYSYYYFNGVDYTLTEGESKSNTRRFQGGAGFSYFLNKNIGVEFLGSYVDNRYSDNRSHYFLAQVGFQIYLSK
jgi:hypothetical protein